MKKILLLFWLVVVSLSSFAADKSYFADKFSKGLAFNFQEKLYVQTDRDSYTTGETIWFRIHRADATYHNPYLYSGLVYVDLYDYTDKLIRRMMISPTDSVFCGSVKLAANMSHGSCYMVAYSNWQQNYSPDLYYRRKIFVNNPANKKIRVTHEFHLESRDRLRADFEVNSIAEYEWEKEEYLLDVTLVTRDTKKDYKVITRSISNDGRCSVTFPIADSVQYLSVEFNGGLPEVFSQRFIVPHTQDNIDLQFMPEGGHLIAGMQQRIGFKAVSVDGLGASVSGTIFDSAGGMVGFFGASHLGMGDFMLSPKEGESYYAEITMESGIVKRFDLPVVEPAGFMIGCTSSVDAFKIAVLGSPNLSWEGKHLLIHSRGRMLYALAMSQNTAFNLPTKDLPVGLLHCSLVDTMGNIYSQRLLFNNRDNVSTIQVDNAKVSYSKRNLVDLDLTFVDANGAPAAGSFTASVVDDKRAIVDTMVDNLRSYLLLSSDLSGNVEYPNYYFDSREPLARRVRNADLLMLTQGWRRFDLTDLLLEVRSDYPYSLQMGQAICGRIKNLWNDSGRAGTLAIISTAARIFQFVSADETGYFELTGVPFPNGTKFVVQGVSEKNKKGVEVMIEEEGFRDYSNPTIDIRYLLREDAPIVASTNKFDEFYRDMSVDFYYENGVKVYIMDEISVLAEEEPDDFLDSFYSDMSERRITSEELSSGAYITVWDWLAELPGVTTDETNYSITVRGGTDVSLLVDDIPYELTDLEMISIEEIESIGFTTDVGSLAMLDGGSDGAIMIRLKSGASMNNAMKETASFFSITPMGYHKSDAFYVPRYDTPDLLNSTDFDGRVTIHWEPRLVIDSNGKANMQFYTADFPASYLVRIEGLTTKGDPISYTMRIKNE